MSTPSFIRRSILLLTFVIALPAIKGIGAEGKSYWTAGHGDLGISYQAGATTFSTLWQLDSGNIVDGQTLPYKAGGHTYQPGNLAVFVNTERTAPSDSFDWLGVPSGATVWRTGDSSNPPNVGFQTSASQIGSPNNWLNQSISIRLSGWSGPGDVALFQNISGLGTVVWFSTHYPGATADNNVWNFEIGDHIHLNWLFTQPGTYELEFTWNGTYIAGGVSRPVTGTGAFGFQVTAVPEPSTWILLLLGSAVGFLVLRRQSCS